MADNVRRIAILVTLGVKWLKKKAVHRSTRCLEPYKKQKTPRGTELQTFEFNASMLQFSP